jgi:hypothetical protein
MNESRLCCALVTRENALGFCNGRLSAAELWDSAAVEKKNGPFLFCNGLRGPLAWRQFLRLLALLKPQGLVFGSCVPSIVARAHQFGAQLMRIDEGMNYYFAEGPPIAALLAASLPTASISNPEAAAQA